jgi:hypothetical protein
MDHIASLFQQLPTPPPSFKNDNERLAHILGCLADKVASLTCKKSLADAKYGKNRFNGSISFSENKFVLQFTNDSSVGFETLVRLYDYTFNRNQVLVTKFTNAKDLKACMAPHDDIFDINQMSRGRWNITHLCECCNLAPLLEEIETLASELDAFRLKQENQRYASERDDQIFAESAP